MQLRSFLLTAAIAAIAYAPAVYAAECTDAQLEAIEKLEEDSAADKACPDNGADSGSFNFESTDPKAWAKISPCKDAACTAFLKTQADKVPDCDHEKTNMKKMYAEKLALCVDLASGKLTVAEIEKRVGNLTDDDWFGGSGSFDGSDLSGSYGDWSGNGSDYDWFDGETDETSVTGLANNATAKNATITPNATTPKPTTKKSGAAVAAVASGATVVAVLISTLVAA